MRGRIDLGPHVSRAAELAAHGDYISSGMIQQLVQMLLAMDREIGAIKNTASPTTQPLAPAPASEDGARTPPPADCPTTSG